MTAQKMHVTWAPEQVRGAVERAAAITKASDPGQVYELAGGRLSWADLACLVDIGRTILADPEFGRETDGPWTVGPRGVRYQVIGEEGGEELLIYGHKLSDPALEAVIRHAGFGRALDPLMDGEYTIVAAGTVAELQPVETWARELRDCPTHGWIPQRLRQWMRQRWEHAFEECQWCGHVIHYRTCSGCGFCASDGSGTVPPFWECITPDDKLAGLAAHVGQLEQAADQVAHLGQLDRLEQRGLVVTEPGDARKFRGLVDRARAIRGNLAALGYVPVTIVNVGG